MATSTGSTKAGSGRERATSGGAGTKKTGGRKKKARGAKGRGKATGKRGTAAKGKAAAKKSAPSVDVNSPNVQEYLEGIYTLTEDGRPARTSELAALLGIKPGSATGMVQKLSDAGLVRYRKYKGVELTAEGMKLGRRMKRKHRILERFLTDVLGIGREKVHDQACAMEHSLSDEAEEAMCRVLGHPEVCSDDGKPIPPCSKRQADSERGSCGAGEDGKEAGQKLVSLSELGDGTKGTIAFIRGGRSVVKRLSDMGLTPDTTIEMEEKAPLKGPVQVRVRGSSLVIGRGIATKIFVLSC